MSREVRRVPIGYQHPHEYNKNWVNHQQWFIARHGRKIDNGIPEDHRFIPLLDGNGFHEAVESQKKVIEDIRNKYGHTWKWAYNFHFVGYYSDYYDKWMDADPEFIINERDPENVVIVRDEDHLVELLVEKELSWVRDKKDYTPVPEVDADTDGFGYALYETVSEGTPVTPVFETPDELIDYLVEEGNFWGEVYDRRNAEAIVRAGGSLASFVAVDGQVFSSSTQAADINDAFDKK